jgi:GR25 family glycosyltransferase involved in LPS biosynthesis
VFTPRISSESVKSIINRNVYVAFKEGFSSNADYVVLIEDDIEVHPSFLSFVDQIHNVENNDNRFRAINGFSASQNEPAFKNGYGKYRFGVGWGWSISRHVWSELTSIWNGNEDAHWDGLIEPFMRKGYVIMPNTSLIKNLGLNGKGANSGDDPVLSLAIEASFNIENNNLDTPWTFNQSDIKWREDCFAYVPPNSVRGMFIDSLFRILYLFRAKNELPIETNRIRAHMKAALFRIIRRMV